MSMNIVVASFAIMSSNIVVASFAIIMLCSSGFPRAACGSFIESTALGNETDRQALLAFKNGLTSDPLDALKSWNQSIHFCQWAGVTCGRKHHQRVVVLDLDNRQLKGPISPYIGNLSFLKILYLRSNNLEQQIPAELGRLRRLRKMSLLNNSIGGLIPVNISGCSNLSSFELTLNHLEGVIPAEFGNSLSKLERLFVGENHLGGFIPSTLANLSDLRIFYATINNIHGSIPDQFGRLNKLEYFLVAQNKLVGTIPPSMFNISSMREFVLQDNQLRGILPSQLGGTIFPSLDYLDLGRNLFDGNIPVSISNASYLEFLNLSKNKFTGNVPLMDRLKYLHIINLGNNFLGTFGRVDDLSFISSLTNISNLVYLGLDNNNFGGKLPHSIGNVSTRNFKTLYLDHNEISGSIPNEIGNLASLQKLLIENNMLTGNMPSTIGKITELRLLYLSSNRLNGKIPTSFGNLSLLIELWIEENNLHGTIPSSLGTCQNLLVLSLFSNNLHGTIPREIFSISSLNALYLHQNHFTGSIPTEIGSLINLEELGIADNQLSGKVPTALGSCVKLSVLGMWTNNFEGILPPSLSSLRGLEVLDVSRNNFSGKIPDFLATFYFLQILNLSFNDFEGAVPERGIFKNTTVVDVKGNMKLCGGVPQLQLPRCNSNASKNLKSKFVILLAVGATGVVLLLLFLYICLSKKSIEVPSISLPGNTLLNLSYQSLREATNGFSAANLIGVGSFGSVYKGLLDQGQQMVAVKVLNLQHGGADRSFMAECEILRSIRHRNLLKVLTACSSIDHEGNDFKALVYEFMPNGSLDDWLHSHNNEDETQADLRILNLSQRLDISIDVASALDYLHHHSSQPIVHCDLKPSNILLDNDMVGHVGDFGLAKFLQEGAYHSSEYPSSTIGLRGSVGYVAPEYGLGNEVSTSGDVYSFGIVLLEMFTGKRPTDHHMFNNCLNLHDFVKIALPEKVETAADSRLLIQPTGDKDRNTIRSNTQNQDLTCSEKIENCLVSVLEVGISCSRELPGDRMAINDAISQLHAIKKALNGTGVVQGGGRSRPALQVL